MTNQYQTRVCAFGSEQDMLRLCRAMLDNCDWLEEPEEDRPEPDLPALMEQMAYHAREEGGEACEFFYGMLARHTYGDAHDDTCRLTIRQEACGLWTASFIYGSETPCQVEDWLRLHRQCDRVPMLILRASWDFTRDKGMLILTGGHALEDWNRMGEIWLWLIETYETGNPPDEAVVRLKKLEETMEREEFDLSVSELLQACIDNLNDLTDQTEEPETLQAQMAQCREKQDWQSLFTLQCRVAESVLWETEHKALWLANLEAVRDAWEARDA